MSQDATERADQINLTFKSAEELDHVGDPIQRDLSALAISGRTLFASCDETATIERLIYDPETQEFSSHESFPVGAVFDLPAGPDGEMDIEGLEISGGWLWVCGSHSLKRDTPDDGDIDELEDIDWDPNRGFLGRLPLLDRGEGVYEPVAALEEIEGEPRGARMLKLGKKGGPVRKMLAEDPLIGPFVDLPCKENGLDIEGLAAEGETVWLGLRGPVLGKHALIVEMRMKEKKSDRRRLKPVKYDDGKRHRVYAVDLGGQAIRDVLYEDGVMYILSGATTDLEAMQSVYRTSWPPEGDVVMEEDLTRIIDLPTVRGSDHAEGLECFTRDGETQFLIAYDSPDEERVEDASQTICVDVYDKV